MVAGEALLQRSREAVSLPIRRVRSDWSDFLQHAADSAEGVHVVLGFSQSEVEGKNPRARYRLPGTGGSAIRLFYFSPEMGPGFVRKLFAETDITLFRDRRQGLDWLAAGKYSICLWCEGVEKANSQGLPVDMFGRMKEGA